MQARLPSAAVVCVLIACALFTLLGATLIPYAGFEEDELGFVMADYFPYYSLHVGHREIPLMINSYVGTLKTFLYRPLRHNFQPGSFVVRLPMVLAGAITIFLFYRFAEAVAGSRAAVLAALLLATDAMFLLTNTFDWGPVALQHLLLVAGCLALVRRRPGWGFFFFGLALWDKAVFVWTLAGLTVAVLVTCFPHVRRFVMNRKAVALAAATFLLGALPLLVYNFSRPNSTLRDNSHISLDELPQKWLILQKTIDQSVMFGLLTAADSPGPVKSPSRFPGRIAQWIRDHAGAHRTSLFPYAFGAAILAAPFWWRLPGRRAAVFSVVCCAVTFLAMVLTKGAGGSVHHTVLLWPFPHLLVGIALAAFRPSWLGFLAVTPFLVSNLLVIDLYVLQLDRSGALDIFTDASNSLSSSLSDSAQDQLYIIDWGIYSNLHYRHKGRLDLRLVSSSLRPAEPDTDQRKEIAEMLHNPRALIIGHTTRYEAFPGVREHLQAAALGEGYERVPVRTVADSNGRPVFELFRYRPAADPTAVVSPGAIAGPH